ncbi:Uncharacterized protein OS=Blastopirellula marina DSM 3645 GN=DSM3645_05690 PE=4 SV=1 [Gemmataceae bacterium]|nr:Uncharacterized protein OS=Blastopirellula marina DSM 3645 GN=DSM3645_05690 PE=4 SV=1 [Gemmataceae bacterium]VTT96867.1 Uncharacterized protein OS=Blastopirellula marina DSM 3645 GN=DSM3645_05690 PE=4 SV=1 [Gemmataceae bacterium]
MRATLWVLVMALVPVGCSGPAIHPVRGTVKFPDGSPLTAGRVALDTGDALTGSWGAIQPDGTFVMGTNTPRDGVPTGTFRVYIVGAVTQPSGDGAAVEPKPLVHERFTRPETSGLSFTVPDQTTWDIVVEKPAKVK